MWVVVSLHEVGGVTMGVVTLKVRGVGVKEGPDLFQLRLRGIINRVCRRESRGRGEHVAKLQNIYPTVRANQTS